MTENSQSLVPNLKHLADDCDHWDRLQSGRHEDTFQTKKATGESRLSLPVIEAHRLPLPHSDPIGPHF